MIGSRSCPNQTKFGMEYPQAFQNLRKENFLCSLPLEKVSFSNEKWRLIRISNFKKSLFHLVKEFFKSIQTQHGVSSGYIKSRKKNFRYSLPLKKVRFLNKKLRLFRISSFKKRSFSSGQGVVQIKTNSV